MHPDTPRDRLPLRSQHPRVRLALHTPRTPVREQPKTLQTRQQPRHLPSIRDPRPLTRLTIAQPWMLRDPFQHPRSPIRQTHRHTTKRIGHAVRGLPLHTRGPRGGRRRRTHLLAMSSGSALVRQHNHPHQLPKQTHQRSALTFQQPRIHDRKGRPDQTLRSQRRTPSRTHTQQPPLIHHTRQPPKHHFPALQHPRATTQRLHHQHPREHRLTIQKPQDHKQPPTHPLTPPKTLKPGRRELRGEQPEDALDHRRQTRFPIREQLIERTPRNPRTRGDIRHRSIRVPQLIHRPHRRRQQPRTLNLRKTLTRNPTITPTPHKPNRPSRPSGRARNPHPTTSHRTRAASDDPPARRSQKAEHANPTPRGVGRQAPQGPAISPIAPTTPLSPNGETRTACQRRTEGAARRRRERERERDATAPSWRI